MVILFLSFISTVITAYLIYSGQTINSLHSIIPSKRAALIISSLFKIEEFRSSS